MKHALTIAAALLMALPMPVMAEGSDVLADFLDEVSTTPKKPLAEAKCKLFDYGIEYGLVLSLNEKNGICDKLANASSAEEKRQIAYQNGFDWDKYSTFQPGDSYREDAAKVASYRPPSSDGCPPGTSMITQDNRWNFLFMRGGKIKEIGCMTPTQLANIRAQQALQHDQNVRQTWRDMGNNIREDLRNQRLVDAINKPVHCYGSSSTSGSIYGYGGGYSTYSGRTTGSTSCY